MRAKNRYTKADNLYQSNKCRGRIIPISQTVFGGRLEFIGSAKQPGDSLRRYVKQ